MSIPISKSVLEETKRLAIEGLRRDGAWSDTLSPRDAAWLRGYTDAYSVRAMQCALLSLLRDGIVTRERNGRYYVYRLAAL